jgi:hypothetical protein
MTTQPVSYNTEAFTEDELTFLDDVSDDAIDNFLAFVDKDSFYEEDSTIDWWFQGRDTIARFDRERFKDVAAYFNYLRSHHERR